jgi:hypothetical protein
MRKQVRSEDSLTFTGLEECDRERAEALGVAQAEELTALLWSPQGDISAVSGKMEREAPLFFGTGSNPTLF